MPNRVSECFDCLVSGVGHRFFLILFIGMTNDEIIYLIHVGLIFISLPQFLTDRLINILLLEVGYLVVSFEVLVYIFL